MSHERMGQVVKHGGSYGRVPGGYAPTEKFILPVEVVPPEPPARERMHQPRKIRDLAWAELPVLASLQATSAGRRRPGERPVLERVFLDQAADLRERCLDVLSGTAADGAVRLD